MRNLLIGLGLSCIVAAPVLAQNNPDLPPRGATMERVEQLLGAPIEKAASVGDPPITRWRYPGFTVYFEHNLVLHTVVRR